MSAYVIGALIGGGVGLIGSAMPLLVWRLNRPLTRRQGANAHTETLMGILDEYRTELAAAKAQNTELAQQLVEARRGREKLLAQVSELRTSVDTTAQQQLHQAEQHARDLQRLREAYERQLGEKELQIVGLRSRVEELERRVAGAGADLQGKPPSVPEQRADQPGGPS